MAKQFTWVPIYQELAKALLGYRNRQQELLAMLRELADSGLPMLSLTDRDAAGKEFPLAVMDPFTFFAAFNRGIRQENRLAILEKLKKLFGLEAPVPTDLDAIPLVNNQQSWFFAFQASRAPQDIDILWDLAKQAIEREPAQMDPKVFSQALGIKSVGAAKLTMGLFWFKPDQYFALDATNAAYCADNGVPFKSWGVKSLADYLAIRQQVQEKLASSFLEVSHAAYLDLFRPRFKAGVLDAGFTRLIEGTAGLLGQSLDEFLARFDPKAGENGNEISNRVAGLPVVGTVLKTSPVDMPELLKRLPTLWVMQDAHIGIRRKAFLESPAAAEALKDLLDEESGVPAPTRIDGFIEIACLNGFQDQKGSADASGAALFASTLLAAAFPSRFVDFRANRWNALHQCVTGEEDALVSGPSYGIQVARASAFAQALSETPSFRRYFGEAGTLCAAAGLAWWFNATPISFWLFQCNPDLFDLPGALRAGIMERWEVRQHKTEIKKDDKIAVWCTGKARGCYALATVISDVAVTAPSPAEAPFRREGLPAGESDRVKVSLDHNLVEDPITPEAIAAHPVLASLPVGKQGTNFRITLAQYLALIELAGTVTDTPKVHHWIVAPGDGARLWDDCRERERLRVGWDKLNLDLTPFDTWEKMTTRYEATYDNLNDVKGIYEFVNVMGVGDRVFVKKGRRLLLAYGEVVSGYSFDPSLNEYRHCRKMKWLKQGEWTLPSGMKILPLKTLTPVSDDARLDELLKLIDEGPDTTEIPTPPPLPGLNVIYYGPPGTGKTYKMLTELAAEYFTDDEGVERYDFVTFHQSYSYEDFIEGIRPALHADPDSDGLSYVIKPGVFRRLADLARSEPGQFYALFIDEINRGNVAGIFGELITLIEDDKREGADYEISVTLPYSRTVFSVPRNLYIIGTMNTADRSIEALDTALRRRFAFVEMPPCLDLLPGQPVEGIDLRLLMKTVNARVEKLLDRDHRIGHSYLMAVQTLDALRQAFKNKILPLLQEYFHGDPGKIGAVLGSRFVREETAAVAFAEGDWGLDEFEERRVFVPVDPLTLTAEDFRSIYA